MFNTKDFIWITALGEKLTLPQMKYSHIRNIINMLLNRLDDYRSTPGSFTEANAEKILEKIMTMEWYLRYEAKFPAEVLGVEAEAVRKKQLRQERSRAYWATRNGWRNNRYG